MRGIRWEGLPLPPPLSNRPMTLGYSLRVEPRAPAPPNRAAPATNADGLFCVAAKVRVARTDGFIHAVDRDRRRTGRANLPREREKPGIKPSPPESFSRTTTRNPGAGTPGFSVSGYAETRVS